jgi:hypothetical protein
LTPPVSALKLTANLATVGRPQPNARPFGGCRRDFLWEHWTQKRPARVVVTVYTIEGDPTTYNLFVEFDRGQRWRVVAKYESFTMSWSASQSPGKTWRLCHPPKEEKTAWRILTSYDCDEALTEIDLPEN